MLSLSVEMLSRTTLEHKPVDSVTPSFTDVLDEEKNGYVARDQLLYAL